MTDPQVAEIVAPAHPTSLRFAIRYSDDSGDELAVSIDAHDRYRPGHICITAVDEVTIPPEQLDFLIGALLSIRHHLTQSGDTINDR